MLDILLSFPVLIGLLCLAVSIFGVYSSETLSPMKIDQLKTSDSLTRLNSIETGHGIRALTIYAEQLSPDYIIGINKGGALVGAAISCSLGIANDKFKMCGVNAVNGELTCDLTAVKGTILIVDSIVRSGVTMANTIQMVEKFAGRNAKIYSAAVVTSEAPKQYSKLSFACFRTTQKNFQLPWTNDYEGAEEGNQSLHRINEFNEVAHDDAETLASRVYFFTSNKVTLSN